MKNLFIKAVSILGLVLALQTNLYAQTPKFKVLILAERGGYHEGFVVAALDWLNKLASEKGFEFTVVNNTNLVDAGYLSQYKVFMQLNYPPYMWTDKAKAAFVKYIEEGRGGWVGFHHASLLGEFDGYQMWDWFSGFLGGIRYKNYIAATASSDANKGEITMQLISNIVPEKLEISFPQIHYITGKTKMLRLDSDSNLPLITYVKESPGTDYLKTTLFDIACYYYISGNIPQYRNYIGQVKQKGRELHNRDIEAAFEANKTELPNRWLMRADYLVKGGYTERAEDDLSKVSDPGKLNETEKVQFYYLRGECKRLINKVKDAESAYLKAFETGKNSGDYISQKALVQAGLMMEKNGAFQLAEKYYHLCLRFRANSNPYSDLYQNKAKAGLIRLSISE